MNLPEIASERIASLSSEGVPHEFQPCLAALRAADIKIKGRFWPFIFLRRFFRAHVEASRHTIHVAKSFAALSEIEKDAALFHAAEHLLQYRDKFIEPFRYFCDRPYRLWIETQALKREIAWRIYRKDFLRMTVSDYAQELALTWPKRHRLESLKFSGEWYLYFRDLCDAEFLAGR